MGSLFGTCDYSEYQIHFRRNWDTQCPLLLIDYNDPSLGIINLQDETMRAQIVDEVLASYSSEDTHCIKMPYTVNEEQFTDEQARFYVRHVYLQLFSVEFMIREQQLLSALQSLRTKKNIDTLERHQFMSSIIENRLVMRRIFGPYRLELAKAVLLVLLDMTALHDFEFEESESTQTAPSKYRRPKSLSICRTISFWDKEHFMFVVENGFSEFLVELYKVSRKRLRSQLSIEKPSRAPSHGEMAFFSVYDQYISRAKEIDPYHTRGLRSIIVSSVNQFVNCQGMCLYRNNPINLKYRALLFSECSSDRKCGWPPCSSMKGKHPFPTRNICKGCRLVRYCCREHQKRHWRFIHRQQCGRSL